MSEAETPAETPAETTLVYTEAEVLAMTPAPVVESPYIITLEELKASKEALQSKETKDRTMVYQFLEPNNDNVRQRLLDWATLGFPDGYILYSLSIEPPVVCLDGQSRNFVEYIQYLCNSTLVEKIQALNAKLPSMTLTQSVMNFTYSMHVSMSPTPTVLPS